MRPLPWPRRCNAGVSSLISASSGDTGTEREEGAGAISLGVPLWLAQTGAHPGRQIASCHEVTLAPSPGGWARQRSNLAVGQRLPIPKAYKLQYEVTGDDWPLCTPCPDADTTCQV